MLNKLVNVSFLVLIVGLISACAGSQFYHKNMMRGQIVGIDGDEVVVCVGQKDGAEVGQIYKVHRYAWDSEGGDDDYRVEYVGVVEIKSVVNEHFARASISDGDVKKHDIVEFKK